MDVSGRFAAPGNQTLDPRLQPTPDYGTLGPGSDVAGFGAAQTPRPAAKTSLRTAHIIAALVGMVAAIIVGMTRDKHPVWPNRPAVYRSEPAPDRDLGQIDRMKPQTQAETLLEMAVGHSQGAVEQISSRVDRWHGKVQWSPQIASLTTAALNSDDMRVRESGVEVELAAYGLSKNSASLAAVLNQVDSADHSQKIWALWALGLMANRGVEQAKIVDVLTEHLKEDDPDTRRWAVEGLALTGADEAIRPLLATMHDDGSPMVRERAACALASSGMFSQQQRMSVVPKLLDYSEDPSLDAQTHGWAFQALGDISGQRLGSDTAAWRQWYEKQVISGQ